MSHLPTAITDRWPGLEADLRGTDPCCAIAVRHKGLTEKRAAYLRHNLPGWRQTRAPEANLRRCAAIPENPTPEEPEG